MMFTDCRTRFATYVAENLRAEVQIAVDGVPVSGPVDVLARYLAGVSVIGTPIPLRLLTSRPPQ